MKQIAINRWFSLPRLGKDVFSDLMKARVKYDTKLGFKLTESTDLRRALVVLSSALNEPVEIEKSCFICTGPLLSDRSGAVICESCEAKENAYAIYTMKFASLAETV